jgi:hypothetical protein
MRGGDAIANMRADVAAAAQVRRRYCEIDGDDDRDDDDDDAKMNKAAACVLSCSMELQQSSRIEIMRDDDSCNDGLTIVEHVSDRKNDEICTQNWEKNGINDAVNHSKKRCLCSSHLLPRLQDLVHGSSSNYLKRADAHAGAH